MYQDHISFFPSPDLNILKKTKTEVMKSMKVSIYAEKKGTGTSRCQRLMIAETITLPAYVFKGICYYTALEINYQNK